LFIILIASNVITPLIAPRIMDQFLIMSLDSEVTLGESISQHFTEDVSDYHGDDLYDTPNVPIPGSSRHPAASGSTTSGTSLGSRAHPTFIMITETNKDSAKSLLAVSNPSLCMLISSLNIRTSHGHLKAKSHANLIGKSFMKLLNSHPKNPNFDVNTAQLILCILVDQIQKYPPSSKDMSRVFVIKLIAVAQIHPILLPSADFSKEESHPRMMVP